MIHSLSLRTKLFLYFLPVSLLPLGFFGVYAIRLIHQSLTDQLIRKAKLESESVLKELENKEKIYSAEILKSKVVSEPLAWFKNPTRPYLAETFANLKARRGIDVMILDSQSQVLQSSFALSSETLTTVVKETSLIDEVEGYAKVKLGDQVFGSFTQPIYSLEKEKTGEIVVFLPLEELEATESKLNAAVVSLALGLLIGVAVLIILFSHQLQKPISTLVEAMKKSGNLKPITVSGGSLEFTYLIASFNEMVQSITATKKALETKLQELYETNLALHDTQGKLIQSAKMASLGGLVAGVAHELNNPIGYIYSNVHHMEEYISKIKSLLKEYEQKHSKLPQQDRQTMEKLIEDLEIPYILKDIEALTLSCQEGAKRTREIVLGLRNFSRGKESDPFSKSDINEGLKSTLRLLANECFQRIEIHTSYGEIPPVECHPSRLNQVFMNLLTNAIQSIEGKGEIWVSTYTEDAYVYVEIEDSGIGMTAQEQERIFDPFYTTKKIGEGVGLGLSIAYGIIQSHQGEISVQSESGVGSRFVLKLPIEQTKKLAS